MDYEPGEEIADSPPRAVIVTIYGLYARELGGWMPVAALIDLLGDFGIDAPVVRSAIFRLKRRGVLVPERRDSVAGYALSSEARTILDAGDRRIFERPDGLDEGWVVAVFSVPESERRHRHTLRSRLDWLGFGTVASAVRIAPAHVLAETRDELVRVGLERYVELFIADYAAFGDPAERVSRWWDLDSLQAQYDEFVAQHGGALERTEMSPRSAFHDYVNALTAWRRLPYLDPGLPASLLPSTWSGARAADLFFELRDRLADAAREYALSVATRGSGSD